MQFDRPFATVTPTLDGDVLTVIAACDGLFTTGQIRRTLNRYSDEGIRKALARLAVQGVVVAERVGNAFAYRLNAEHVAAGPIQALARLGATFITRLEHRLGTWEQPPVYAAVFGCAASGEMSVDSDVDIFLVRGHGTPDSLWDGQVAELAEAVTRWTGNDVRVVEYDVVDLRTAATTPMMRDVLVRGVTVAGSRDWLIEQLRADVRGS